MFMQVVLWHFLFLLGITHVVCLLPSETCSDMFEVRGYDGRVKLTGEACGSCRRAQPVNCGDRSCNQERRFSPQLC